MNKSLANLQKLQQQQENELKKQLLAELAVSIDALAQDDELEPWAEVVGGKSYVIKKIENQTQFGTFIVTFEDAQTNKEIRLPLILKLG